MWDLWGAERNLLRRVLDASRVEVCNVLPGSGEQGRAGRV